MNVNQLIKELKKQPKQAKVFVFSGKFVYKLDHISSSVYVPCNPLEYFSPRNIEYTSPEYAVCLYHK